MDRGLVRREMVIRSTEDVLEARECLRELARKMGCDLVHEAKLVAGLSDLAERFYLNGRAGRLVLCWDGDCLEAVLEHEPVAARVSRSAKESPSLQAEEFLWPALGGVRFMWDAVAVDASVRPNRVVLKAWPSD